jgi:hypothetical protein
MPSYEVNNTAFQSMLFNLVSEKPLAGSFSKIIDAYRQHWFDTPSMEELRLKVIKDQSQEPEANQPDPYAYAYWFSIVTDADHSTTELNRIALAWETSIRKATEQPHMSLDELTKELDTLGFPYMNGM